MSSFQKNMNIYLYWLLFLIKIALSKKLLKGGKYNIFNFYTRYNNSQYKQESGTKSEKYLGSHSSESDKTIWAPGTLYLLVESSEMMDPSNPYINLNNYFDLKKWLSHLLVYIK